MHNGDVVVSSRTLNQNCHCVFAQRCCIVQEIYIIWTEYAGIVKEK